MNGTYIHLRQVNEAIMLPWVIRRHSCASQPSFRSFVEDKIINYYEGARMRDLRYLLRRKMYVFLRMSICAETEDQAET